MLTQYVADGIALIEETLALASAIVSRDPQAIVFCLTKLGICKQEVLSKLSKNFNTREETLKL